MKADLRRKAIAELLLASDAPIAGGELSRQMGVSRQIIVGDIAALKKDGYEILSTHHGYLMQKDSLVERVFKVRHTTEETGDELSLIVSLGGTVHNVFVWHKVYGRIEAPLNIYSQYHVDRFMEDIRDGRSTELMHVTAGYHYHTVRAENEEILDRIEQALKVRGYWVVEL